MHKPPPGWTDGRKGSRRDGSDVQTGVAGFDTKLQKQTHSDGEDRQVMQLGFHFKGYSDIQQKDLEEVGGEAVTQ